MKLILFFILAILQPANAILPTAGVEIHMPNGIVRNLWASQASFGERPPMSPENGKQQTLSMPPSSNPTLCQNVTSSDPVYNDSVMMIPRGTCTFELKALNAQKLGAAGVIIYGNLGSRYSVNETTQEPIYPSEFYDFDCKNGHAGVPASAIAQPYNAEQNDIFLKGDSPKNLCFQNSPDSLEQCESKSCLLTGNTTDDGNLEACCAWDLHIWLYSDPNLESEVNIPAVYLTMSEADEVFESMSQGAKVVLYTRWVSDYNLSSVIIWLLGVVVAAIAAYASATDYRWATRAITNKLSEREGTAQDRNQSASQQLRGPEDDLGVPLASASSAAAEESLELSAEHAIVFIIMASSGLFILFFFKIYNVVKVMYAFGCSKALMQVIFEPIWKRIIGASNKIMFRTGIEDIGDVTTVDVAAFACAYTWGFVWLAVAFTVRHPETMPFFWITQDIMGSCMCIMFLSVIKLNSMKVASILLMVAFFYDIFFVFITPLIFKGQSVMITVATSGGPPKGDPAWCEKYPDDANCQGGDPLPMLLTIPRVEDFTGGASMLGLGDIVLPGLLLSFAARLDAAKRLVGVIGGGNVSIRTCQGYFGPLIVAYAIGLMMANIAVYLMNYGQPALLYLVPCCLGTVMFIAWRQSEVMELWNGPKVIRAADSILYRDFGYGAEHEALPTDEGMDAPSVPSASQDAAGSDQGL